MTLSSFFLQIQPSQNPNDIWIIFGSWALVAATLFGILLSNRRTKESNNLLRSDLKARVRPILARTEIGQAGFEEGVSELAQSDHAMTDEKALFHFQNVGELSAINITKRWDIGIWRENHYTDLKSSCDYESGKKLADMAPKEKYSIDIEWDPIHHYESRNSDKCCFRLILEYEDSGKNKYSYHLEGHFFGGGYVYLDSVRMT